MMTAPLSFNCCIEFERALLYSPQDVLSIGFLCYDIGGDYNSSVSAPPPEAGRRIQRSLFFAEDIYDKNNIIIAKKILAFSWYRCYNKIP